MKHAIFVLVVSIALGTLVSCEDNTVRVKFFDQDTVKQVTSDGVGKNDYEGSIPYLDSKVIDYTLPDEYQHKSQLLRNGITVMSWDKAGFKNAKQFIKFFEQFQFAVQDRNKEKIATYIKFPLQNIATKKEFIENFEAIFYPEFADEIIQQNPSEIYRDERGAMIGKDGQLWFKPVGSSYKIVAINW